MKIILDPEIFKIQHYGGISRYYTEVFSLLKANKELDILLPLYEANNIYLQNSNLLQKRNGKNIINKILVLLGVSIQSKKSREAERHLKNTLQSNNYDLFVPTFFNDYFLPLIGNTPFVLTVYDMIHELFPQYYINDPFNVTTNKLLLMENAYRIIAVSENTKKDILKIYPQINASKITVIYHGNSILVDNSNEIDLPEKYILFVGSRDNYKNFILLLESIYETLQKDKNLILLCAGSGKFNENEQKSIKKYGLEHQVLHKTFRENELGQFYKKAICFVFPSAYEGFGIPILEAMANDCPVILTNNSSFPEVAGKAGIYFELNNMEGLKNKINWILENETIRNEYIKKGKEQVKKFDWKIASEQILQVYKDAIATSK